MVGFAGGRIAFGPAVVGFATGGAGDGLGEPDGARDLVSGEVAGHMGGEEPMESEIIVEGKGSSSAFFTGCDSSVAPEAMASSEVASEGSAV